LASPGAEGHYWRLAGETRGLVQDSNRTPVRQAVPVACPANERDFQAMAFARGGLAWYVAWVMRPSFGTRPRPRPRSGPRRRPAAIGALSAALLIVSCGTDRIDLLPPIQAEGGSGYTGSSSIPSAGDGGDDDDDPRGSGGALTNGGGANSGGGGSGGGCVGEACGGFMFGGAGHCDPEHEPCSGCRHDDDCRPGDQCSPLFGGVCVECLTPDDCDPGYACEQATGQCVVACEDLSDCDGQLCDTTQGLCVECLDHADCKDSERNYCDWVRRCVECMEDWQCGSGRHCNIARGYCED
jgi:hypothetical protein